MQGVQLIAHQVQRLTLITSTHSVSAARNASSCLSWMTGVVTPCLRMYKSKVVPFTTLQHMMQQGISWNVQRGYSIACRLEGKVLHCSSM